MNAVQKRYAIAKAAAEAADKQQLENTKEFIRNSGYKNPDGSVPTALWMIDDCDIFLRLCDEFEVSPLNIYSTVNETMRALEKAEDELIDYALSLVPASVADTLRKHRRDAATRQKMIDAAFRLDTSTVPNTKE